ncbi:MAG: hypothetical protein H6702_21300 [Myxococcales bacterium]|nr:hypothetical protein [Myxococcales bacterium]
MIRAIALLGLTLALAACNKPADAPAPAAGAASKAAAPPAPPPPRPPRQRRRPASAAATEAAPAGDTAPASAAAGEAAPAAELPAGAKENAEATIALMEEMGQVMADNAEDCDKMGEGLEGFVAKNKDKMAAVKAGNDNLSPEQRKAAIAPFQQRMQAAMMKIMGPGMKCKDNARVTAAMKAM